MTRGYALVRILLAMALLAAVVWLLRHDGDGGPAPPPSPAQPALASGRLEPSPAGGDGSVGDATRSPTDVALRTPLATGQSGAVLLRGTVTTEDGRPIRGAILHAHPAGTEQGATTAKGTQRRPPPALSTARSTASGTYELVLPLRLGDYLIDVGARAAGWLPALAQDIRVTAKEAQAVDFVLTQGLAISGQVTGPAFVAGASDRTGTVPGWTMVAVRGRSHREDPVFTTDSETDDEPYANVTRHSEFCHGAATVGQDGRFLITGLAPGEYALLIRGAPGLVHPSVRVPAGSSNVLVHIVPACRLHFRVEDPGREIDAFSCLLSVARAGDGAGGPTLLMNGWSGTLTVDVDLSRAIEGAAGQRLLPDEPLEWTYRFRVPGYQDHHGKLTHAPLSGDAHIVVNLAGQERQLRPLELMVAYADGPWPPGKKLTVHYAPAESAAARSAPVEFIDGRRIVRLPEGTWWIKVAPEGPMAWANVQVTEVLVGPSGGELHDLRFPRPGSLRLHATEARSTGLVGGKFSRELDVPAGGLLLDDVPPGRWRVTWQSAGVAQEATVTVTPGGEAVVALDP